MQDKRIDEAYIDEAWKEMKALLDAEMPVERKRRRFLPFLWLFLGVGGVVAAGLFRGSESTQALPARYPVASHDHPEQSFVAKDLNQTDEKTDDSNAIVIPSTAATLAGHTTPKKNLSWLPGSRIEQEEPVALQNDAGHQAVHVAEIESLPLHLLPSAPPVVLRPRISSFESLPLKRTALLDRHTDLSLNVPAIPGGRWFKELEFVSGGWERPAINSVAIRFALGLTLDRRRRWRLQSGLGWAMFRYDESLRNAGLFNSAENLDAFGVAEENQRNGDPAGPALDTSASVSSRAEAVATNDLYLRAHYLTLPLTLSWRPATRWEFGIGGEMAFLLGAKFGSSFASDESFTLFNSGLALDTTDDPQLNPIDWSFRGNVYYHLNRHWRVGVHYHYGFRPLFKDREDDTRRRFLGFGVLRRF